MKAKRPKPRRRHLGGVTFECIEPGFWLSLDRHLCISHVMVGTGADAWELYRTQLATGDAKTLPHELYNIEFGMHVLIESYPLGGMKFLAREIEHAADWRYNLASCLHDAGDMARFYNRPGLTAPTLENPIEVGGRIITRGNRLPRLRR